MSDNPIAPQYTEKDIDDILQRPEVSFWLKKAIRENMNRDPVDAMNDSRILLLVQRSRCESLVG